jgi:hypothetical protein
MQEHASTEPAPACSEWTFTEGTVEGGGFLVALDVELPWDPAALPKGPPLTRTWTCREA